MSPTSVLTEGALRFLFNIKIITMNLLESNLRDALTNTLKEEIELFRKSDKAKLLNTETFDPLRSTECYLGQTGQQTSIFESFQDTPYRATIGIVPPDLGLARLNYMTPLEIWSAYYWDKDKELVLKVLQYIKGEIDTCPEVVFAEQIGA